MEKRAKNRSGKPRGRALRGLGLAIALVATGCGLGGPAPSDGGGERAKAGSIEPIDSLQGVEIKVGSKDFTEQLILGQISIAALEAAGAKPVDKTSITGSDQARKALLAGNIDTYWEYVGTAWEQHLRQEEKIRDVEVMAEKVTRLDAKNGIKWLPPSPLINSYGLTMTANKSKELGITKMSELKTIPEEELTFCVGTEFYGRANDGYKPMMKYYGIDPASVPTSNVHNMQDGLVYGEVAKEEKCNFASTFTTDGRIAANNLITLEDDKGFWPPYNVAVNIRMPIYEKYPELAEVFRPVSRKLTTEAMQELTTRKDVEGQDARTIARDWLKQEGFIS